MKKLIYIILLIMFLSGCELPIEYYDYTWEIPESITSVEDINALMSRPEYNYRNDPEGQDIWNFPDETYYGTTIGNDCEDTAFLYAYLYERCLHKDSVRLVGLRSKWTPGLAHMIFSVDNVYYQSTGWNKGQAISDIEVNAGWEVIGTWTFDEILTMTDNRRN